MLIFTRWLRVDLMKIIGILLDCPGTESSSAGQVSACQGCPNQTICASGVTQLPDPGKSNYLLYIIILYIFFFNVYFIFSNH